MSFEIVPSEEGFLSEASHDDLFEVMKTSMSKDIAGVPKRNVRRAFLKGVFVTGLAFGIGLSAIGPVSEAEAGLICIGICNSCYQGCDGCYQGCDGCNGCNSCYSVCDGCYQNCNSCYNSCNWCNACNMSCNQCLVADNCWGCYSSNVPCFNCDTCNSSYGG